MSFSAGGGPSAPQMNVTPLIDVLLVLLIIFMLVVIEQKPKGFDAQIPRQANPDHSVPPPETTIIIQVRDSKTPGHPDIKINNEVVSASDLRQRLDDIFSIRVERIAFVEADDDIDFEQVADVIDAAHAAHIDRLGLLHDETASVSHH